MDAGRIPSEHLTEPAPAFQFQPDALLVLDPVTLRIVQANEQAALLYGYERDELLGLPVTELSAEPEATRATMSDSAGSGTYVPLRRHRRHNGEEFPVEITTTVVRLGDRALTSLAIRDVTERERRELYTSAVSEIQHRLLGAGDAETLPDLVLEPLLQASRADRVYVLENRADADGTLRCWIVAEAVRPGITPQIDNPVSTGVAYEELGEPWLELLSDDVPLARRVTECSPELRELLEAQDIRSLLLLPLHVHGEFYGLIGFDNCTDDGLWDFAEVALLTTAATALSAAIERQVTVRALRQRTDELSVLLDASKAVASTIDYDDVVREIARAAGQALGSPECVVWECVAGQDVVRCRCLWERDPKPGLAVEVEGTQYPMRYFGGEAGALRAGVVTQQSYSDEGLSARDRADMEKWGERTWLTVPLVFGPELIGMMVLIESERERRFSADELRVAQVIGELAAVALDNARRHRRQEERTRWLNKVLEAVSHVTSTLDVDGLLSSVARLAAEAVLSPVAFIYEYDAEEDVLITRARYGPPGLGRDDPIGTRAPVADSPDDRRALDEGQVFVETLSDPRLAPFVKEHMESDGETTLLNVPFRFKGEALGLLVLVETERERVFTDDEIVFMRAFGKQVAVALNNARLYARIEAQATYDGLTGLANHRSFYERLEHELAEAERYEQCVSLLMIDIDGFKGLNDTHGHLAGDEVLRQLGSLLAGGVRHNVDLPARYGGEEFAVILPNTPIKTPDDERDPGEGAQALAERLRALVASHVFILGDGRTVRTTVTIGIACYPDMASSMDDLVARADAALYAAKRAGKDRVEVY